MLFILAASAVAGAIASASGLPSAHARFAHEPEDLIILLGLALILGGLGAFWVLSGVQLLRAPANRVGFLLRGCAWLVLVIGCLFGVASVLEPLDLALGGILSMACVLSAVVVLSHGIRGAGI